MAEREPSADELRELQEQFASLPVDDVLASAASTVAALASAKLDAQDLAQAKRAIDALASLAPHLEGDVGRDLQRVLASLQVAYAGAVPR